MEVLNHFFRQQAVDSDNDNSDNSKTLDCWEFKDSNMAAMWTWCCYVIASHSIETVIKMAQYCVGHERCPLLVC